MSSKLIPVVADTFPRKYRKEPPCNPVTLILDGVSVGDPFLGLRSFALADVESIEYYTPVEAGYRFGLDASANGALVIWTRGRDPHRSQGRIPR